MLSRLLVVASFFGLAIITWLLFSNHPGVATKLANWIYFVLIMGIFLALVKKDVKKS